MQNIILCGFMGCGKTTVGKILSRMLSWEYLDLDEMIEDEAGKPIPVIFSEDGEQAFRDLEHEVVSSLAKRIRCVVSAGGGTMVYERNRKALSPLDTVVFLDADFESCYSRIKNSNRPLVCKHTNEELETLFNQRYNSYLEAAQMTVDARFQPQTAAEEIAGRLP